MAQLSPLPHLLVLVIAIAALFVQSASAWSFQWRDDGGDATIELGMKNQSCKAIDHGKHQPFEWDPKDDHFCISMFSDKKCEKRAGYTCTPWVHDSSVALKAFEVNGTLSDSADIFKSSTTNSETQPTTTSSMTTSVIKDPPPTDTSTSLPQTDLEDGGNGGGDDNSLSGGAIAGIVIGIIAVLVLILIAWMIFRRRRSSSPPQAPSTAGYSAGGSVPPVSETGATTVTANTAGGSVQPISKWGGAPTSPTSPSSPAEEPLSAAPAYSPAPPEGTNLAELSTTNQIVELQGSDPVPPKSSDEKKVHEKP